MKFEITNELLDGCCAAGWTEMRVVVAEITGSAKSPYAEWRHEYDEVKNSYRRQVLKILEALGGLHSPNLKLPKTEGETNHGKRLLAEAHPPNR